MHVMQLKWSAELTTELFSFCFSVFLDAANIRWRSVHSFRHIIEYLQRDLFKSMRLLCRRARLWYAALRRPIQRKPHHRKKAPPADGERHAGHGGQVQRSRHPPQGKAQLTIKPQTSIKRQFDMRCVIYRRSSELIALQRILPFLHFDFRVKLKSWLMITSALSTSRHCLR